MTSLSEKKYILASKSPQRQDVMRELGLEFTIITPEANEISIPENAPATVRHNAETKAVAAWQALKEKHNCIIVAADTVMTAEYGSAKQILGKPSSVDSAEKYLKMISGQKVDVYTGVAIIDCDTQRGFSIVERSAALIRELTDKEIDWYISTGEPLERAGAFGISRRGEIFVQSLEGSYSCFAGLPKLALFQLFAKAGILNMDIFSDKKTDSEIKSFAVS
jgi:septum formation protein